MNEHYQKILDFMLVSGKRLVTRAGKIADIGITKTEVTEEDVAIERGFKEIIDTFGYSYALYAEEEHNMFQAAEHVWIIDPISGTKAFLRGQPHYSIVVAHLIQGKVVFAAVYDPSVDEMFTAYKGKGAFLNGEHIHVTEGKNKLIFKEYEGWKESGIAGRARKALAMYSLEENIHSMAVNYCSVAAGRSDGIVSFVKDSFPEFAGGFIISEAGGIFTNLKGESHFDPGDRIFVGGNMGLHSTLLSIVKEVVE